MSSQKKNIRSKKKKSKKVRKNEKNKKSRIKILKGSSRSSRLNNNPLSFNEIMELITKFNNEYPNFSDFREAQLVTDIQGKLDEIESKVIQAEDMLAANQQRVNLEYWANPKYDFGEDDHDVKAASAEDEAGEYNNNVFKILDRTQSSRDLLNKLNSRVWNRISTTSKSGKNMVQKVMNDYPVYEEIKKISNFDFRVKIVNRFLRLTWYGLNRGKSSIFDNLAYDGEEIVKSLYDPHGGSIGWALYRQRIINKSNQEFMKLLDIVKDLEQLEKEGIIKPSEYHYHRNDPYGTSLYIN